MLDTPNNILFYDTETTGLWPWPLLSRAEVGCAPDRPFAFSFMNTNEETAFFRAEVDPFTREVIYRGVQDELEWLKSKVQDRGMRLVCHNLNFDRRMTEMIEGIDLTWRCQQEDTLTMSRVVDSTVLDHRLNPLCKKHFEIDDDDEKALLDSTRRSRNAAKKKGWRVATKQTHQKDPVKADYWLADETLLEEYSVRDVYRVGCLFFLLQELLDWNAEGKREEQAAELGPGKLWDVYENEMQVIRTSYRMETHGMTHLDDTTEELRQYYSAYMRKQRTKMKKLGHGDLNPQSPKQMKDVFIEQKGYRTSQRTRPSKRFAAGQPKIDAEQLMAWARGSAAGADVDGDGPDGDRLARAGLEWKAGKKVIEYLDSYDFFTCLREDGSKVIHPNWNPNGAVTGRYSCSAPNLQQITSAETSRRHSQIRARNRECFGPRPGHLWYLPDYSQIEVWVFAFCAQEKAMIEALLSGHDFHFSTARAAWGDRDDFCTCGSGDLYDPKNHENCLSKWWRQRAKMILFSKFYGGGLDKIADLIRCSKKEARGFVEDFENQMPGVPQYMRRLVSEVSETGILINLFGREYRINPSFAYKSVNYMIQGSSADVLKRSLVRLDRLFRRHYPEAFLCGSVHDEVVIELPEEYHNELFMRQIIKEMQRDSRVVPGLKIPLPVTMAVADDHMSGKEDYKLAA
jgi:DNA polymerase I-like protein with 3'-5' exonuclease and polymerase domains